MKWTLRVKERTAHLQQDQQALLRQGQEGLPVGEVSQQPQPVCESVQDLV